jgi:hypothetical protein
MAGKNVYVSREERAHAVALFRETPNIAYVAKKMGWGVRVTRRVLVEEKAYDKEKMILGRNLEDSIALTKEVRRFWYMGMAQVSIMEELGIAEETIKRITKDIPRPYGPRFLRRPATTIPQDEQSLSWLAGVFDAAANIGFGQRRADLDPTPYIRIYADASLAATILKVAGCGTLYHPKERAGRGNTRFQWEVRAMSDCLELLERVEPYLRDQGPLARRVLKKYEFQVNGLHDQRKEEPACDLSSS